MDYARYLPYIDVNDGKTRVMDNLKLYVRLVAKFDGRKMAGEIVDAINSGDTAMVAQKSHALRGTAANLGFTQVQKIAEEIEILSKQEQDSTHLKESLNEAIESLVGAVTSFLETQE